MAKPVKIITDSTADLPPEIIERYNIDIVPLTINIEDSSRLDGVDVNLFDLFKSYERTKILPKTAAAAPSLYAEIYKKYADYDVISFHVSSFMSASYSNAVLASENRENIISFDSQNLSTGIGLLVYNAARMAQGGAEAREIVQRCEYLRPRVRASFVIDTLEYLWKGGRCSALSMLGANLLKLKPCIHVKDGEMGVGHKYRGRMAEVIPNYVRDQLKSGEDIDTDTLFITHTCRHDDPIVEAANIAVNKYIEFDNIIRSQAGATIACHCGPDTLGVLYTVK